MTQLSICMPSNRPWAQSRAAIESALFYAENVGARLIVSDNARDPEKQARLENLSPNLTYHRSAHEDVGGNWLQAMTLATTPFLLPMGDDDLLRFDENGTPVDLATLPLDIVGVRPSTEIWRAQSGVHRTEAFTIDALSPAERFREYAEKAMGNNSIFYSIYRTDIFLPLLRFFRSTHPTQGGYCDWSLSFALMTSGRIVHDPSLIYRYDIGDWATDAGIAEATAKLYRKAGLPEDAGNFADLLRFLDIHVFTLRRSLPLTPAERNQVLLMNGRLSMAPFLRRVEEQSSDYNEVVQYLAQLIRDENDIQTIFSLAVLLADCIRPGLKDGYVRFFQAAQQA